MNVGATDVTPLAANQRRHGAHATGSVEPRSMPSPPLHCRSISPGVSVPGAGLEPSGGGSPQRTSAIRPSRTATRTGPSRVP
ncbi:MAG: hypothetical protein WAW08_09990, partial [Candidatus Microthrix parvicella]